MSYGLQLRSSNCPDGAILDRTGGEPLIRYATDARSTLVRELDLREPLVQAFVRAVGDRAKQDFVARHGIPLGSGSWPEAPVGEIERGRVALEHLMRGVENERPDLTANFNGRAARAPGRFAMQLRAADGKFVMETTSPFAFMLAEVGAIKALGRAGGVTSCKHCGALVVYGKGTGMNAKREYCPGDRCRKAASRLRATLA